MLTEHLQPSISVVTCARGRCSSGALSLPCLSPASLHRSHQLQAQPLSALCRMRNRVLLLICASLFGLQTSVSAYNKRSAQVCCTSVTYFACICTWYRQPWHRTDQHVLCSSRSQTSETVLLCVSSHHAVLMLLDTTTVPAAM